MARWLWFGRWLGLIVLGLAAPADSSLGAFTKKGKHAMNEQIPLYSWVRGGAAINLARIAQMSAEPGPPAQEKVTLQIRIEKVLWGHKGAELRRYELLRPTSEVARLKFPNPVWGRVALRDGIPVLLVIPAAPLAADPVYVEELGDAKDPQLASIHAVLDEERSHHPGDKRVGRYLQWLAEGPPVERLFGAEALAKDGLPEPDPKGRLAPAFATAFGSERNLFIKLSLGTWMLENIYPKSNAQGEVAVLNATIRGAADPSEDVRRFSIDRLAEADPAKLRQPGIVPNPEAIRLLQAQLAQEVAPNVRDPIKKVIDALITRLLR